jgi:hypothetical protein
MVDGLAVFIAREPIYEADQRRAIVRTNQNCSYFYAGDKYCAGHDVQISELPDFLLEFFDRAHFVERLYVANDNSRRVVSVVNDHWLTRISI